MTPVRQLREIEPFNRLPENQFQELAAAASLASYPADCYIFHQDDIPTGFLYIVREGLVAITVLSPDGTDIVVDHRREGQLFGGTPVFTGEPYSGAARTVKPTTCHLIPATILQRLQKDNPELSGLFTRVVLSRVRSLYSEIVTEQLRISPALVEAYPFKKHLAEIMTTDIECCPPEMTAKEIARRMVKRGVGAVLVVDARHRLLGMVTERELVTRVVATESANRHEITASEIMTPDPPTMTPETYMYEAMAEMTRLQLKYLPVTDREEVSGIVSLQDLMRYRSHKAMLLIGNIRGETSLEGLAAIRRELPAIASSLLAESRSTPEVMEILSYVHHGIMRRVFELCLTARINQGDTLPDIRYCFLVLGSGGRREMLLGPDQDHALVFEDAPTDQLARVEAFFAPLAVDVVQALQQVGYPPCEGKVMADDPRWRGSLSTWQTRIRGWVADAEPQQILHSSIFFDFTALAGDHGLAAELHEIVRAEVVNQPGFLYQMMTLDLRYKVPIGLLGRFIVERSGPQAGKLSLKLGGTLYLVDCVRMFALEKGVVAPDTVGRLKALVAHNVFSAETAEHIRAAFEALTFMRLRREIERVTGGEPPDHYLDPNTLGKTEQDLLREAFQAVSKLQDATKRYFAKSPF